MLRVVEETIFHPGHYCIALARSRDALPTDHEVTMYETENGPRSLSTEIETDPQPPVIVDRLWLHAKRPAPTRWATDSCVPSIECEGCVFQIIQFMAEYSEVHEGGFPYHHYPDVIITADASLPMDQEW